MISSRMSAESITVIVAALLVGSVSKAITGFGLPLVAVPVMATFIGVETSVVVMVAPIIYSNLALMREFRDTAPVRGLWTSIAVGFAGIMLGTWILKTLEQEVLALVLAAWIGIYLLGQLVHVELPVRAARNSWWLITAVGLGGIFQGATGIGGPIVVTMLHAMQLERRQMLFSLSAVFGAYAVAQIAAMSMLDLFTRERLIMSLVAMVPVVIGLPIGLWLGRRISVRAFNLCVLFLLAILGVKLAYEGVTSLGI